MTQIAEIQEIVDHIVDYLAVSLGLSLETRRRIHPERLLSQLRELKPCALVNRPFSFSIQRYMLSELSVSSEWVASRWSGPEVEYTAPSREPVINKFSEKKVKALLDIFKRSPHRARHLHTMRVFETFGYLVQRYDYLKELLELLHAQGNPRHLHVNGIYDKIIVVDHQFWQQTMNNTVKTMKCMGLEMGALSFIASNRELQLLDLFSCSGREDLEPTGYSADDLPLPRARPKSLAFRSSSSVIDQLLQEDSSGRGAVDFSDLQYLQLTTSDFVGELSCTQRLLNSAGSSLKEISMNMCYHFPASYPSMLNFSSSNMLHTAQIAWVIPEREIHHFDNLLDTLSSFPCPNGMESLAVNVLLVITSNEWRQRYLLLPWNAIDGEICRISNSNSQGGRKASPLNCQIKFRIRPDPKSTLYEDFQRPTQDKCVEFVEDLKNQFFNSTTSDNNIVVKITAQLYLY